LSWWDICLNVNGDKMEVWCVPAAAHVSCIVRKQNIVLGITLFVTLFLVLYTAICMGYNGAVHRHEFH
jgi:hypothetical protein